jgi:hypothetical protein
MKWLLGLGIVVTSFFISLWTMNYFDPLCPKGESFRFSKPFQKATGFAYIAAAPQLNSLSDSGDDPVRSSILVCEDNHLLGPGHSKHAEIGTSGKGRFSHWKDIGFVLSASDNSDPNTNGRSYIAVQPR